MGKLNFKIADVIRAAFGLAMVDGGFIIAIQIISFLLNYFGANLQFINQDSDFTSISKATFLVSIIGMLNLSVIIYRVTGLSRGIKYSPGLCYQQAFKRWPLLIILYIIGSLLLLTVLLPLLHIFKNFFDSEILNYNKLLMLAMLLLVPYGLLACIFVIDQEKNPLQAIIATITTIKQKISMLLLFNISILYALPFSCSALITSNKLATYFGLFNAIWFLFCHILIIVIYAGATVNTNKGNEPKATVIVI